MTATQKTARKQALHRSSNGRFAKRSETLKTTRRTRSVKPAAPSKPRKTQRSLPAAPAKVLNAIEVKAESTRVQWFAIGSITVTSVFFVGMMVGWFMRSSA